MAPGAIAFTVIPLGANFFRQRFGHADLRSFGSGIQHFPRTAGLPPYGRDQNNPPIFFADHAGKTRFVPNKKHPAHEHPSAIRSHDPKNPESIPIWTYPPHESRYPAETNTCKFAGKPHRRKNGSLNPPERQKPEPLFSLHSMTTFCTSSRRE